MVFVVTGPTPVGILLKQLGTKASSEITTDCTKMIDTILMSSSYGYVSLKMILEGNKIVPNLGTHNYYLNPPEQRSYIYPYNFINLIKKRASTEVSLNQEGNEYMYVVCFSIINKDVLDKFI